MTKVNILTTPSLNLLLDTAYAQITHSADQINNLSVTDKEPAGQVKKIADDLSKAAMYLCLHDYKACREHLRNIPTMCRQVMSTSTNNDQTLALIITTASKAHGIMYAIIIATNQDQ